MSKNIHTYMSEIRTFPILLRLKKAHLNPGVNDNINPSSYEYYTESCAQKSESPIEAPHNAIFLGLLNFQPKQGRINKGNRNGNPSYETGKAPQEWNRHCYEEAAIPEHGSGYRAEPPRARLVHAFDVFGFHIVKHGHAKELE